MPPTETPSGPPNLTGETIKFYHFGDLSGPYAAITAPLLLGAQDAVASINAAGGVFGAALEIEFRDTGGVVDNAVAAYDAFTSEDGNILFMLTYGTGEAETLASRFAEDEIPNVTAGVSSTALYGPDSQGWTFGIAPIHPDQFGYFLSYLKDNWNTVKPAGGRRDQRGPHQLADRLRAGRADG